MDRSTAGEIMESGVTFGQIEDMLSEALIGDFLDNEKSGLNPSITKKTGI